MGILFLAIVFFALYFLFDLVYFAFRKFVFKQDVKFINTVIKGIIAVILFFVFLYLKLGKG